MGSSAGPAPKYVMSDLEGMVNLVKPAEAEPLQILFSSVGRSTHAGEAGRLNKLTIQANLEGRLTAK